MLFRSRAVELVRDGVLGTVREVHVWFDRPGADKDQPPQGSAIIPDGLHWDLWLGGAAARPYHPEWMAYAQWRDFSNGGIGTFGPHAANLAFMALKVDELWQRTLSASEGRPLIRVRAETARINRVSFPRWEKIRWLVPARGDLPPVAFTWHHGAKLSPGSREFLLQQFVDRGVSGEESEKLLGYAGALMIGSKGALATDDHNVKFTLLPRESFSDVAQDRPKSLKPSRGHYHDWFNACRGGEASWSHFGYAGSLSEFLMLGNIATQFDAELEYDPVAGEIVNHGEAHRLLRRDYRAGWEM